MSDIWTDFKALINAAPKTGTYSGPASIWDDSDTDPATQYIVVQENGTGGSDEDVELVGFDVFLIGAASDEGDALKTLYDDAKSIYRYLLNNYKSGCIVGVTDGVGPNSPRYGTDGRAWSKFTFGRILYSISE